MKNFSKAEKLFKSFSLSLLMFSFACFLISSPAFSEIKKAKNLPETPVKQDPTPERARNFLAASGEIFAEGRIRDILIMPTELQGTITALPIITLEDMHFFKGFSLNGRIFPYRSGHYMQLFKKGYRVYVALGRAENSADYEIKEMIPADSAARKIVEEYFTAPAVKRKP